LEGILQNYQAIQCHIPEGRNLHYHHPENQKTHIWDWPYIHW